MALEGLVGTTAAAVLHLEIQQFYGRHMRAMDEGRVADWTADFTEDAVFATNARPRPQEGRAAIAAGAEEAARSLAEKGIVRRHVVGTLEVDERPDGTVVAKTDALIVSTPSGGQSTLELMCTCEDVFVRREGRLFVQRRQVYRDDLPR